jgi:hypothetical protein
MTEEAPKGVLSSPGVLRATIGYQWSPCPKMTLRTSLSTGQEHNHKLSWPFSVELHPDSP